MLTENIVEIRKKLAAPFKAEEIEWRIQQASVSGDKIWAMCLAYVQARAIQDRLDDVLGIDGWKVEYKFPSEFGVIAALSLRINGVWITKEDGAEQTDIEAFKGGISSALKRSASAFGLGRYLYDLETGFATIVDGKTPGRKYGKTDKKSGEKSFYWLPPSLPAWALPNSEPKPQTIEKNTPEWQSGGQVLPKTGPVGVLKAKTDSGQPPW